MALKLRNLVASVLMLFPLAGGALGATYYIDPDTGSDANSGASEAERWRSFIPLFEAAALSGENTVALYGDIRESVDLDKVGSGSNATAWLTIDGDPDGDGDRAVLIGSDVVGGYDFTSDGRLIAYYRLEEADNATRADSSGNGYDLADSGGVAQNSTDPPEGSASADFDGSDEYLSIAAASFEQSLYDNLTLTFWYQPDAAGTTCTLISNGNADNSYRWQIFRSSSTERLRFRYVPESTGSATTHEFTNDLTDGNWYFIAVVVSQNKIYSYVYSWDDPLGSALRGLQTGRTTDRTDDEFEKDSSYGLYLGRQGGATFELDGGLDEVCIWNDTLDEWEIRNIMLHGVSGDERSWQVHSGNVYKIRQDVEEEHPTEGVGLVVNGTLVLHAQDNATLVDEAGEWYYDHADRWLYYYSAIDPSPSGMEVTARSDGLETDGGQSYVHIKNIIAEEYNYLPLVVTGSGGALANIKIENVHTRRSNYGGMATGYDVSDVKFIDCESSYNAHAGLFINGETAGGEVADEITISGLYTRHNKRQGIALEKHKNVLIKYSLDYATELDEASSFARSIQIGDTHADGSVEVYNYTSVEPEEHNIIFVNDNEGPITIKNGIFYAGNIIPVYVSNATGLTLDMDHNLYHRTTGTTLFLWESSSYASLDSLYSAHGLEQHGLSADPLFTDPANGDFALQPASPCIDAGVNVGLTEDYANNPILGDPDIGALEWFAAFDFNLLRTLEFTPSRAWPLSPAAPAVNR